MKLRPKKPRIFPNTITQPAPKFLAGDPITDIEDGTTGVVQFSRHDGWCNVTWDGDGREWVHQETLRFADGFHPTRR